MCILRDSWKISYYMYLFMYVLNAVTLKYLTYLQNLSYGMQYGLVQRLFYPNINLIQY